jgi:hypothetical protein
MAYVKTCMLATVAAVAAVLLSPLGHAIEEALPNVALVCAVDMALHSI